MRGIDRSNCLTSPSRQTDRRPLVVNRRSDFAELRFQSFQLQPDVRVLTKCSLDLLLLFGVERSEQVS